MSEGSPRLLPLALLSAAVMLFEVVLTRVLSFSIWHHFASMVLSLALLGFSLAGVALQVRPHLARLAAAGALGFGLSVPLITWTVALLPFDPTRLMVEPQQFLVIVMDYVLLALPFALAGLAIVAWLRESLSRIGVAYAADLGGAAVGGLGALALMNLLGVEPLLWVIAMLGGVAAWLGSSPGRTRPLAAIGSVLFLAMALVSSSMGHLPPGPSKALARLIDPRLFPQARRPLTRWHSVGRVDLVDHTAPISWLVSADGTSVPQTQILIDGDAGTPILDLTNRPSLDFLRSTVSSAAYQIFHPQQSLVIGSGGGVDVLTALQCGVAHVDAVEVNPIIYDLVTGRYDEQLGNLFDKPGVYLHLAEGRSYVHRSNARYDSIQLSLIDTWAATASGAHSLAEAYLYTVEAFEDYLSHLNDNGVLTITRWYETPPREPLKLCTTAMAALRALGQNEPEKCIAVVGSTSTANVMISRSPLTPLQIKTVALVSELRGLKVLYVPGVDLKSDFNRVLAPGARLSLEPMDYTPATDDRPFFFQFGRWGDANPFGSGWRDHPTVLSGRLVLGAIFLQALPLALGLLAIPYLAGPPSDGGRLRMLAHFGALGVGFMLAEVGMVQQFTLYLGHPVYAVATVVAALLFWAGLGSLRTSTTARWGHTHYVVLLVVLVVYSEVLSPLLWGTFAWPWAARLVLTWVLAAPLGYLLGQPMPQALKRASAEQFGWAWAANGCGSVLGPIAASMWALDMGFSSLFWLAALAYVAAAVTLPSPSNQEAKP